MTTPFDGQHIRRHDGVVHVVCGASERHESPRDGFHFYLKCGGRAKFTVGYRRQNTITEETVTCMGCLSG